MKNAVRYYSRSGNTKTAAEAIARAIGTDAVSVDSASASLQEPVDVLFIGGALYAYGIDKHLKAYLGSLKKDQVKKAVVFSTSWISKHAIDLIKDELNRKGIPVEKETLYFRGKPGEKQLQDAANVARRLMKTDGQEGRF
ncbi:MAG: flavodoxin domain-containing protein [Porcincola intestinalis]|uniref:flavodoxin family protein n=1 Tax=Porcincola intestinalis TaxID=2606632 RepID=UPI0029DB5DE3|nr:flavodoxin domain-containing protein [Porcincola intestinalis]MCI6237628.1 flavodoxin [Lachnospiraceae bacterium]MDY5332199.1 flavodoxin domain-containing protein [Porcincola intestinalis]